MVSQFYLAEERRIRRGRRIWNVVSELVLAEVHPGNLGALPPSPRLLIDKAHALELINADEAAAALWVMRA